MANYELCEGSCLEILNGKKLSQSVDLTFLDPPFNQNKQYALHNDKLSSEEYWDMMKRVCQSTFNITSDGGAIYFMQREKNTEDVLRCLRETRWTLQNLIIWKKKTSAVPQDYRYGKHYQIIAFATKGKTPRVFNKLRIDPPLLETEKYRRPNGMYVTDVWDDIRELTSGYFAGDEPLRGRDGERFHKQQSPIALLLRIILSSTQIGDMVFDPFAGTGTTLVVASQLDRNSIGIEIDPQNIERTYERLRNTRKSDNVESMYEEYAYTSNLDKIWSISRSNKHYIGTQKNHLPTNIEAEVHATQTDSNQRKTTK
jgi:DNA modification methylase